MPKVMFLMIKGYRMHELGMGKAEKLCSRTAIGRLFAAGESSVAYPLRMVAGESGRQTGAPAQFMITVPKKKIRKAVGRVLMRRRIREAYRLNRKLFVPQLEASGKKIDIAFVYLAADFSDYQLIERKMKKLLGSLGSKYNAENNEQIV